MACVGCTKYSIAEQGTMTDWPPCKALYAACGSYSHAAMLRWPHELRGQISSVVELNHIQPDRQHISVKAASLPTRWHQSTLSSHNSLMARKAARIKPTEELHRGVDCSQIDFMNACKCMTCPEVCVLFAIRSRTPVFRIMTPIVCTRPLMYKRGFPR